MDSRKFAEETLEKVKKKMKEVALRNAHKVPYITTDGHYDDRDGDQIAWWTNGFWGGLMWEMEKLTGDSFYADLAVELEEKQDANLMDYEGLDHDNGFKWLLTSVYHYKKDGDKKARNRSLLAASHMAGRYNIAGHFIRAWNDHVRKDDDRGWAIIDCMMNLPLLYWAYEETKDPRFYQIAKNHADRTAECFVRDDGSVCHIVEFDPFSGERVKSYGGQGYGHGSSWTRGQAWAIYGFTLSYMHTGDEKYLNVAKRVANYFIANTPSSGLIPCDFRQPEKPDYEDTTAAAIASCGMIEIAKHSEGRDSEVYMNAAMRMLKAIDEKSADWNPETDNITTKGTVAYHDGEKETGILYGDYFFIEALMKLCGIEFFQW